MAIVNNKPTVVKASSEKVFDSFWIKRINISSPKPHGKSYAEIVYCPLSLKDGSILETENKRIHVQDLFEKAKTNSKINKAIEALIEAIDSIINEDV
jgi:hypothetical protein